MMTRAFLYILGSSSDPDNVECVVPYQIDDRLIFFGPCKKRLRERLRSEFLLSSDDVVPHEDLWIIGANGSNREQIRKLVWVGQITRIMTFEVAYNTLVGPEYAAMRSDEFSPLHVKPCYDEHGRFTGYELISRLHEKNDQWILDLTQRRDSPHVTRKGKRLLVKPGQDRGKSLPRDCCLLCRNVFFARGQGIPISDGMLEVLCKLQPEKTLDSYAIFGRRKDGSVEGLAGRYLTVSGGWAEQLMALIQSSIPDSEGRAVRRSRSCDC